MPRTGSVRKPRKKKVKIITKDCHVLRKCAKFLAENMSPSTKEYWKKNALRRNMTIEQITALYLIQDFGLTNLTIAQLYK